MNTQKTKFLAYKAMFRNFRYRKEIKSITTILEVKAPETPLNTIWLTFASHHSYQTPMAIHYLKETLPLLLETHCLEVDPYHKFLFQQLYWDQSHAIHTRQQYQKCAAQLTKILIIMRHCPVKNPQKLATQFVKEKQGRSCF